MAKRFTDTDKWKKRFIRGLEPAYKVFWLYLLDDCNHAGIWDVDIEVAKIKIGCEITEDRAKEVFKDKIDIFDDGEKWFIKDFILFQYGTLNENNRVHLSIINILNKFEIKPLISPLQRAKDKDKDMDKDKDKDKEKEENKSNIENLIQSSYPRLNKMKEPLTFEQGEKLEEDYEFSDIEHILGSMYNYEPLLKKNISTNLTIRSWLQRGKVSKKVSEAEKLNW